MTHSTFRSFTTTSLALRRQTALTHHCRLAFECSHPRFSWLEGGHGIVLTVNTGYE